ITGETGAGADELAAGAVERLEPLGDRAVLHAVDDAQRLHPAALQVGERAVVVECGESVVHSLQPLRRLIGTRHGREGQREGQPADTLATSDSGSHCLARLKLADPTLPACWRFPAHSPSAPTGDSRG